MELSTADEVDKALGKDQEQLREKAIGVSNATTTMAATEKQGQDGQGQQGGAERGALRMRGLPYSASKDDIKAFFSAFKVAEDGIHIMMDHTGRPSGQALVVFETSADAQEAMRLDKEKIGA